MVLDKQNMSEKFFSECSVLHKLCVDTIFLTHVKVDDGVEKGCRFRRRRRASRGSQPILLLPMGGEGCRFGRRWRI